MARETDYPAGAIFCAMGALQVDDDLLRQQQEAYKVQGVDENELVTAQQLKKKRKQQANADEVRAIPQTQELHPEVQFKLIPES